MLRERFEALLRVLPLIKVKICGITNSKDARLASEAGADMIGVIVKVNISTPREVSVSEASTILEKINDDIKTVAVTMPENLDGAKEVAEEVNPDYLQIHSKLSGPMLEEIRKETGKPIIGVSRIPKKTEDEKEKISQAEEIAQVADFLLLDTKSSKAGGTGRTHNWKVSSLLRKSISTPLILAGGLKPSNVEEAIRKVNPQVVDTASGIESEPGKKDPELLKKFVERAGGKIESR